MVAGPALFLWIALGPFAVDAPQEGPPAAPRDQSPRAQAQRILEEGHYQRSPPSTLTDAANAASAGEGGNRANGPDEPRAANGSNRSARGAHGWLGGGWSADFVHAPLLVPIVVGVLLLLLLLLGITRTGGLANERRRAQLVEAAAVVDDGALAPADRDPDALAAEGRFAEAIHVLLLRALRGLARSIGGFARGLTSREILPRAPDGAPRAALEELVAAVELHEFGAQELSARDFERCRAAAAALPEAKSDATNHAPIGATSHAPIGATKESRP